MFDKVTGYGMVVKESMSIYFSDDSIVFHQATRLYLIRYWDKL